MTDNSIEYRGYTIKIEYEDEPQNPREWDNLGRMICFHSRYTLGDKHNYQTDDYGSWQELAEAIIKEEKVVLIFPLYLYDHSGLRIKIGDFHGLLPQGHAEFDSGQVGFIIARREDLKKEYSATKITEAIKEKAKKILASEVATYDDYLSGNVYRYTVENEKGEFIDSCGGYFGYEGEKQAIAEAKSTIDFEIKKESETKQKKLKAYIKHNVPLQVRV